MILSDQEIQLAIQNGQLILDPLPRLEHFSPSAVDLQLAQEILTWDEELTRPEAVEVVLSYDHLAIRDIARYSKPAATENDGTFVLRPGKFVLGQTVERVGFPLEGALAARIEGRSSLARLGVVVHLTAPTIHTDFGGATGAPITLEIVNLGPFSLRLQPGSSRICQLIVEEVAGEFGKGLDSAFREQNNPLGGPTSN